MKRKLEDLGWTPYEELIRWRRRALVAWVVLVGALVILIWRNV